MATYVLIHGAGDSAFYWHRVVPVLRDRGHEVVAVDLPCDDDSAGLAAYTDTVVAAIGDRTELIVVAQSFAGFTAPLVCARVRADLLVLLAAMVPVPGERAERWAEGIDRGRTASTDDDDAMFYHDVPPAIAAEAKRRERAQSMTPWRERWPLAAWPSVPTKFLLCRDDRVFPVDFMRRLARDRLGVVADELACGHCAALAQPAALVAQLEAYRTEPHRVRYAAVFDAEAPVHDEQLHAAAAIRPGEHVLDIGCGTGLSTRTAAAIAGRVLGVDISEPLLAEARRVTSAPNVAYEQGDTQVQTFARPFDVAISRFGVMFFADPAAAFANIARALRPGGRLAFLVWQRRALNEWAVAIEGALGVDSMLPAFSLAEADATERVLEAAGFRDIRFTEVDAPVRYGRDADEAFGLVRGFRSTQDALAADPGAEARLRAVLAAHQREGGVMFEARTWVITATRT
jgi:SAM-dependent methyltransferase